MLAMLGKLSTAPAKSNTRGSVYVFIAKEISVCRIAARHIAESRVVPKTVKDQLTRFSSDMYSIKHLFLNFQDANLIDRDRE